MLDKLIKYVEINIELFKLDLKEGIVRVIAKIIRFMLTLILLSFMLLFVSLGLALYLNQALQSQFYGFMLVGGAYAVLFVVFWLMRYKVIEKVQESIDEELPIKIDFLEEEA